MDDVRRGHLRLASWQRVSHGVYTSTDARALHAWQLVLPPSGCLTHLTAAAAYGLWLPPLPDDVPVFARQSNDDPRPRRAGLRITRHTQPTEIRERDGLRLVTPTEALLGCARDLSLLDLVVLVDAALHLGVCTDPELAETASRRRAGAPLLRRAVALADGRAESVWESPLRVLHVVCEVDVEPQHEVHDDEGRFVARGDLWLTGTRVLHEYDGGDHLARSRQRSDLRRGRRIANTSWIRRGYTADDVVARAVTILRDADLSLGRPHRPERVRVWHAMLVESLFTPTGTARFRAKLGPARRTGHELHLDPGDSCSS